MPLGIICGRITPARGNLEHRPLSGAVTRGTRLIQARTSSTTATATPWWCCLALSHSAPGPLGAKTTFTCLRLLLFLRLVPDI